MRDKLITVEKSDIPFFNVIKAHLIKRFPEEKVTDKWVIKFMIHNFYMGRKGKK